jgi:hypothetical protein
MHEREVECSFVTSSSPLTTEDRSSEIGICFARGVALGVSELRGWCTREVDEDFGGGDVVACLRRVARKRAGRCS